MLKCDVRKYFASIDHQILNGLLGRAIKCRPTLDLAARIIDGWNAQEEAIAWFTGDDLFAPFERRRGLPLGNQTSQFFANVYLDPLDQHVNRALRPDGYVRYVDDFLVFSRSKAKLAEMRAGMETVLEGLRLRMHEGKSRVYRCADGVTFLGWWVFPDRSRLVRENVARFRRRLREMERGFKEGRLSRQEIQMRIHSWIGHAAAGNTWSLRGQLFAGFTLVKGSAV